jgi:hypothetical protein
MKVKIVSVSLLFISLMGVGNLFGQIELKKEEPKKEDKKVVKKDGATSVFVTANWSSTSRKLVPNDGLAGKPLGERENEEGINAWSFELGIRNQLHKYVAWEGGIAFMQNGEKYSFSDTDTSYKYDSHYSYIGMPIKVHFTYGENFKLLVGGGIVPQMFVGFKQNTGWTGADNDAHKETVKTKIGYNSFVFSAVMNVGLQVNLGGRWSVLVMPEYKVQLTTSYANNPPDPYKHFARSLGFNMGVIVDL